MSEKPGAMTIAGTPDELLQGMLQAQMATQLLTIKAMIDYAGVDGGAVVEAMDQIASHGGVCGEIVRFMADNIDASLSGRAPPAAVTFTVIDGGKA